MDDIALHFGTLWKHLGHIIGATLQTRYVHHSKHAMGFRRFTRKLHQQTSSDLFEDSAFYDVPRLQFLCLFLVSEVSDIIPVGKHGQVWTHLLRFQPSVSARALFMVHTKRWARSAFHFYNVAHRQALGPLLIYRAPGQQTRVQHFNQTAVFLRLQNPYVPERLNLFSPAPNHRAPKVFVTVRHISLPERKGRGISVFFDTPPLAFISVTLWLADAASAPCDSGMSGLPNCKKGSKYKR
mmetsp:Transcript_117912/g.229257  ORF Transcript_117912/g.229257 Transcript_117912/m.229257 type:complete len:239 (-) Transcript_117912:296-1012(-)